MSRKRKNEFSFDEEKHEYRVNGFKVPSVTQVIRNIFGDKPYWNEEAREIGSALHKAIDHCVKKLGCTTGDEFLEKVDNESIDERIRGRIGAYVDWLFHNDGRIQDSEVQSFDPVGRFAGTIDQIILSNDKRILVDLKSSHEPESELQIGGYLELITCNQGDAIHQAMILELRKDGTYKEHPVRNLAEARKHFLSCLHVYNWKVMKGLV